MRKSTIPEWAIARERLKEVDPGDEILQDAQFLSYLVVFGSSLDYGALTAAERSTADRLLRMGVLIELPSEAEGKKVRLADAWLRAIEARQKNTDQGS